MTLDLGTPIFPNFIYKCSEDIFYNLSTTLGGVLMESLCHTLSGDYRRTMIWHIAEIRHED